MEEQRLSDHRSWRLVLALLGAALAGSLWAALAGTGCAACEGLQALVGGKTLAFLGVGFYALLILLGLIYGPSLPVFVGIQIAGGIHGSLLALMAQREMLCWPCILTAVAAIAALGVSIRLEPANAFRASFVLPGAAFTLQSFLLLTGASAAVTEARLDARRAVESEVAAPWVETGRVRLVAFTRPDCGYCLDLEKRVVPALKEEFGDRLTVEERSASSMPGLPTPTLIIRGRSGHRVFPGLPPLEELARTIRELKGEDHAGAAVLPEPR